MRLPDLGITVPGMGSRPKHRIANAPAGPADALFTATQQRVIGLLFGHPDRSFSVSEIIAATGAGSGATQRELARLAESGLATMQPVGNQKRYQANPYTPVYDEMIAIVRKTLDTAPQLPLAFSRDPVPPSTEPA